VNGIVTTKMDKDMRKDRIYYDIQGFQIREFVPSATCDKDTPFNTNLHYSEPNNQERTVFGEAKDGLFYNYNDRLIGNAWYEGIKLAQEQGLKPDTARFFECALNNFHGTNDVDLQHVILGCNRSNGFSYLVFGYTYTTKVKIWT
jgi:hypothetical protein